MKARKRVPAWAWLLLGSAVVYAACGVYALYAVAEAVGDTVTSMQQQERERARWTRAEFTALVEGKTTGQVIAAVGKPDSTGQTGFGDIWYYNGRTRDTVSGKVDFMAQVVFTGGKVSAVNY